MISYWRIGSVLKKEYKARLICVGVQRWSHWVRWSFETWKSWKRELDVFLPLQGPQTMVSFKFLQFVLHVSTGTICTVSIASYINITTIFTSSLTSQYLTKRLIVSRRDEFGRDKFSLVETSWVWLGLDQTRGLVLLRRDLRGLVSSRRLR